jgi:hypothetical protein
MDAAMHKNGMMMIKPVREKIDRYVETQGTNEQLKAFELQAAESGLTTLRQSKRQVTVNLAAAMAEIKQLMGSHQTEMTDELMDQHIASMREPDEEDNYSNLAAGQADIFTRNVEGQEDIIRDAIKRNTIYKAKYKITGYNINIKFHPIAQHYWVCDPTVPEMKDQPFCGFYDPMTIQEATELYPEINLEEFRTHTLSIIKVVLIKQARC